MRPLMACIICAATAAAQTPEGTAFEAASIKLSDPVSPETSWNSAPGMLRIRGMTLKNLIVTAYGVKEYQVTGGPKWVDGTRYDIIGKFAPGGPMDKDWKKQTERMRAAIRALLAERFQLLLRKETKLGPGYALVVGKSGLRLKPLEKEEGLGTSSGPGRLTAKGASMDNIADLLAEELRQPVVNRTNVAGIYEFRLQWAPDIASDNPSADRPAGPSLFTALQETLGLKLESQKLPVELLVVAAAEKAEVN
jgi:uncharacterized protein (TIGR03435 family)